MHIIPEHPEHTVIPVKELGYGKLGELQTLCHCTTCDKDFINKKWSAGCIELIWKAIQELQSDMEFVKAQMEALRKP